MLSVLSKNSLWYFIGNVSLKGINIFLIPFYTFLIEPVALGTIYTLLAVSEGLVIILGFSLRAAYSKYFFSDHKDGIYSAIVFCQILILLFFIPIYFSVNEVISSFLDIKEMYLNLVVFSGVLNLFFPLLAVKLQMEQCARKLSILTFFLGLVLTTAILFSVYSFEDKIEGYLFGVLFQSCFQFSMFLFFSVKSFKKNFSIETCSLYFKYAFKFFPSDICGWIVNSSDRLMLFSISGPTESAIYNVSYKMGQVGDVFYHSINRAYVPIVYKYLKENKGLELQVLYRIVTITFMGVVTGGVFFTPYIVSLLESSYQDSVNIIYVVFFSYFVNSLKIIIHNPMSFYPSFVSIKSFIWILTALINISLNLYLIPLYGALGAASSTLISFVLTYLPVYVFSQKAHFVGFFDVNLILFSLVFILVNVFFIFYLDCFFERFSVFFVYCTFSFLYLFRLYRTAIRF
ncbi:MAG: oligosaccharide flippase family protein [Marinomonas sp.]